jgi:hypothetical protein
MTVVVWLDHPEDHDFDAAAKYLSLIADRGANLVVDRLRTAGESEFCAKDVLRASGLPLLSEDNEHVAKDLRKVEAGKKLSPVLLVRGNRVSPLVVADGYHRVCAAYHVDENVPVRCRIVSWD